MNTQFILIHGLCGLPITLIPMKWALQDRGYKNVHIVNYASMSMSLEKAGDLVHKQILKVIKNDRNVPVILIGHSFGGIISYHLTKTTQLNISLMILVACPIRSCKYLEDITSYLPYSISNFILNKIPAFRKLLDKEIIDIKVPYYTVTTNIFYSDNFDGKIYTEDAVLNKEKNYKIENSSHNFMLIDKICLQKICEIIDNYNLKIVYIDDYVIVNS